MSGFSFNSAVSSSGSGGSGGVFFGVGAAVAAGLGSLSGGGPPRSGGEVQATAASLAALSAHIDTAQAAQQAASKKPPPSSPSSAATAERLTPALRNNPLACDFYKQVEAIKHCGSDGYALAYGLKYCERFRALESDDLSPQSLRWRNETLVCLQQELRDYLVTHPDATCGDIARAAFHSHPGCYVSPGNHAAPVCALPMMDVWTIAFHCTNVDTDS